MANPLADWLAHGALQKAAGTASIVPTANTSTDPTYLQKQIAMNPNNFPQGQAAPDPYETKLTPDQEKGFQAWKVVHAPHDSGEDYDLRGFFQSGLGTDERGHATDKFKKPNHPTFSVESQYSTAEKPGGQWVTREGKTFFTPSHVNLAGRSFEDLQSYFQKYEPNVTLIKSTGPPQASAGAAAPQPNSLMRFSNQAARPAGDPFTRLVDFLGGK